MAACIIEPQMDSNLNLSSSDECPNDWIVTQRKTSVAYVASQDLAKISSLLPSNKNRSKLVHSLVRELGLLSAGTSGLQLVKPARASPKVLAGYHSRDYLDYVLNPQNSSREVSGEVKVDCEFGLQDDCPLFAGLPEYVQLVAGASLTAAHVLRRGEADIAICWDGGRHHAQRSQAAGFCYVADCVLAILALKQALPPVVEAPQRPRVMYLDLDLHYSDAVSQAFYSPHSLTPAQVLTFSVHHAGPGFFPVSLLSGLPRVLSPTFDPFTLSLPLLAGASSSTFARIWPIITNVKDAFKPHYVVVQCGVDGLAGDPCSVWNWDLGSGEGSLGWCVSQILDGWDGRKLLLGGGGYHSANAARAWAYLTSIALGTPLSLETRIPDYAAFPLFSPSFMLDVPSGNMQDQNTDTYMQTVERCFGDAVSVLKQKMLHVA